MRNFLPLIFVAGLATITALASGGAVATTQRTFVASNGGDSNPCSLSQPCRSFGAAINQTNDSGEIVVLDSAGYGKVTIAKSVTITAPAGVYAGISVFTGDDGVTVDAPSVVVALRGLTINGQGGGSGVRFAQGSELRVERCSVFAMTGAGLVADLIAGAILHVRDSTFSRNTIGIQVAGTGIAAFENVHVSSNTGSGVALYSGTQAALRDAIVDQNGIGIAIFAVDATTSATVSNSRVFSNYRHGILAQSSGPINSVVNLVVTDSEITRNNQGLFVPSAGVFAQALVSTTTSVTLTRTNASYNHGAGVYAQHAGATVYLTDSVVEQNTGYGITAQVIPNDTATIYTRQTNTIVGNAGGDVNGNVVPYAGQ